MLYIIPEIHFWFYSASITEKDIHPEIKAIDIPAFNF
jgi:hypothetical protein